LSLYLRQLEQLAEQRVRKVSSSQLAASLHITAAQVRKDLACFGQFGRPGVGYRVAPLIEQLRRILGTDKTWNVVVVGAGDLGRALLRYKGFERKGFRLVAAFDVSAAKVGKRVGDVVVRHVSDLDQVVRQHDVKLAVVAVPAHAAQEVTEALCRAGVMGILNFAPTVLQTPSGVAVGPVDLAAHLEQLSFRVSSADETAPSAGEQEPSSR
jgi:redox-sensing transcriptional repressor